MNKIKTFVQVLYCDIIYINSKNEESIMDKQFITENMVHTQTNLFADVLLKSNSYSQLHESILESKEEYSDQKIYEIVSSGFIDFNQHLYEDINHMNSLSTGLFIEMSLVTYRIFIWSSKGEGFEIFKHVLRGDEIAKLNSLDDIKQYLYIHLNELEKGIFATYNKNVKESYEDFGNGIEKRQLPLNSILQYITLENNISDFR